MQESGLKLEEDEDTLQEDQKPNRCDNETSPESRYARLFFAIIVL